MWSGKQHKVVAPALEKLTVLKKNKYNKTDSQIRTPISWLPKERGEGGKMSEGNSGVHTPRNNIKEI